jgi:hypothetical protein
MVVATPFKCLWVLIAFALLSAALAQELGEKDRFVQGEQSSFTFDWRKDMIFVPVRLNGSKPLSFVLDSGSARMLVDRTLANDLGLKSTGQGSLQGAGAGRIPIEFIQNVNISLPGLDSAGYEFATADLQPLQDSLGVKVDGILGYEFFRRFVVSVDYESKILSVTLPRSFRPGDSAQSLPIELRNKWAFVKGELALPGSVTVQDSFMIDGGSGDAVDHPIIMKLQSHVPTESGKGLGSAVAGATAQATSFRLGKYSLPNPTVSCCGGTEETSKLIGNGVLKFFTVTFDYPSSRLLIAPNASFSKIADHE